MKSPSPIRIIAIAASLALLAFAASEWQSISSILKNLNGAQTQSQSAKPGGPPAMPPMPVEVLKLLPQLVEEQLNSVGAIEASASALIRPEISGRLVAVSFSEGTFVEAGTILARIADQELKAARDEAKANYDLSVLTYKRTQVLGKQGIASAQTRDEAEAKMRQAEALLAKADAILEKTILRAPFAGVVGLREIDEGAFVEAGATITHLEALNPVDAEFDIPERELAKIAVGQKISVHVEALPGENFLGTITAIAPRLEKESRSARVKAIINNDSKLLRPGMFAYLSVNVRTIEDALMVPEEAIIHRGQQTMICVVEDGKAKFLPVTLGVRREKEVQIIDGVKAGAVVVTAGHMKLQDGAMVMAMQATPAFDAKPELSKPEEKHKKPAEESAAPNAFAPAAANAEAEPQKTSPTLSEDNSKHPDNKANAPVSAAIGKEQNSD